MVTAAAVLVLATAAVNLLAATLTARRRDQLSGTLEAFGKKFDRLSRSVVELTSSTDSKFEYIRGRIDAFMDIIVRSEEQDISADEEASGS